MNGDDGDQNRRLPAHESQMDNYSKRGELMADGRRTRWVAHDVYFLDDTLGGEVFDRFGAAGVALWFGFIAACKKNHIEGEITYSSEPEALALFGLPGLRMVDQDGLPFTLEDFFEVLGHHKVIRRSRRVRRVKVVCTRWGRWQQAARTSRKAEQQAGRRDKTDERNRRSEGSDTATMSARSRHDVGPLVAQMTDTDTDTDKTLADAPASATKDRPRDLIFEAVAEVCGIDWRRMPANERGRVNTAAKQLRDIDATPDEIRAKAAAYRKTWPDMSLTPMALVSNWSQVDAGTRGVSLARCEQCDQPLGDSHDDDKCAFVAGLLAEGS